MSASRPWPAPRNLSTYRPVVVGFDDGGQRAAFVQRRDVAGGGDGSHGKGRDYRGGLLAHNTDGAGGPAPSGPTLGRSVCEAFRECVTDRT